MSPEYAAALEAAREASRKFQTVTVAYRAREISDDEYLAARVEHDAACAAFDAAFEAEQNRSA